MNMTIVVIISRTNDYVFTDAYLIVDIRLQDRKHICKYSWIFDGSFDDHPITQPHCGGLDGINRKLTEMKIVNMLLEAFKRIFDTFSDLGSKFLSASMSSLSSRLSPN